MDTHTHTYTDATQQPSYQSTTVTLSCCGQAEGSWIIDKVSFVRAL